jgi:hypothetical protein
MGSKSKQGSSDILIQTRLPGELAAAVAHIADDEGESVAGWVRRLVFREMNVVRVKAWVAHARRLDPKLVFAGSTAPTYWLRAHRVITPLDRVFVLTDRYGQPLENEALLEQEWFKKPSDFRFVLDRSPTPWRIVTTIGDEITLHAEVESVE